MAVSVMSTALTYGLLALWDRLAWSLRPSKDRAVDWLRDAARPPPGLELRSTDGSVFTGVAAFERNKLVFMLAVRSGQAMSAPNPPLVTPHQTPAYQSPRYDSPRYDHQPSRPRDLFEDEDPGDGWPPDDPYLRRR